MLADIVLILGKFNIKIKSMVTIYRFVGDEEDPRTKKWGLKRLKDYTVKKKKIYGRPGCTAFITLDDGTEVKCPYESENAFNRNWR